MSPRADIIVGCAMLCVAALIAALMYFGSRSHGQQAVAGILTSIDVIETGSGRTRRFREVATLHDDAGSTVRFEVEQHVARLIRDSALPTEASAIIEANRSIPKAMELKLRETEVFSQHDYQASRRVRLAVAGAGAGVAALIGIALLALGVRGVRRTHDR